MAHQPSSDRIRAASGLTKGEVTALAVAVGWVVVVGLLAWMLPASETTNAPSATLRWITVLFAMFMPVGLILVAAAAVRSTRIMREELFRMQVAIDGLRQVQIAQQALQAAPDPFAAKRPVENAQDAEKMENTVSGFTSRREVSGLIVPRAAPQAPVDQPALALDTTSEDMKPPLERIDLIQALNFPDRKSVV